MSDWMQDPQSTPNSAPQNPQETPAPADDAAAQWSSTAADSPVTPPTPPAPPTYGAAGDSNNGNANGNTGGYSNGGNYHNGGWQSPPSGGYRPPNSGGNNYGWQQPPTPPQKPKKKKNGAAIAVAILAVVFVACVSVSLVLISASRTSPNKKDADSSSPTTVSTGAGKVNDNAPSIVTADPQEEGMSSRDIVSANLNSTVIIRMYNTTSSSFYFQETNEETEAGEATGIVWTADGYIITNAHCVYDEDSADTYARIEVELYNGTVYESAEIIGYDTATDLAVLKVDAENLSPASFGDSDALAMGDRVIALGNNSGLGWSTTQGIISGLARDVYEETNYAIKCLQVDAVINPGNSGGPLLNTSGQVIAINSAKIVASGYEGLGFSIPINEATPILEDLVTYGYVKGRIMLGIEGKTFDQYSGYEGFRIYSIGDNSSFSDTSVQVGDIITHINGVRVKSYAEMREQITSYQVGDQVTVTLIRINRNSRTVDSFDVTITLMESDGSV